MHLSEADTRAKLIDPALHKRGWTEDLIRREETDHGIDIIDGKPPTKGTRKDMLAEIGFGIAPKSRKERVEALHYKHHAWFETLPPATANALLALARQFERGGTEELENPYIFNAPDVVKAGGHQALKILGEPKDIIAEMKRRLFAG